MSCKMPLWVLARSWLVLALKTHRQTISDTNFCIAQLRPSWKPNELELHKQ